MTNLRYVGNDRSHATPLAFFRGVALGLAVALATTVVVAFIALGSARSYESPTAETSASSGKARRLGEAISEGINCGALAGVAAVPLGIFWSVRRARRMRERVG